MNVVQGVLLKICDAEFLFQAVLSSKFLRHEKDLRTAIYVWLIGLSLSSIVAVGTAIFFPFVPSLEAFTYHLGAAPAGDYRRISSTFITPSMFCNYLNVGLILTMVAHAKGWLANRSTALLIASIVVCSFLTVTIGIGIVLLSVSVWIWITHRKDRPTIARLSLAVGLFAMLPFAISAFVTLRPYKSVPFSWIVFGLEIFPSSRLLVWQDALFTFISNPLYGIGPGLPVANILFQNSDGSMSLLTDAHNFVLSIAAQAGVFGLLTILAIPLYVVYSILKKKGSESCGVLKLGLGLAFLAGFGLQGLTGSFEDARHLWVLLGFFIAADGLEKATEN